MLLDPPSNVITLKRHDQQPLDSFSLGCQRMFAVPYLGPEHNHVYGIELMSMEWNC